ncbi:MAG: hypothetical protein GX060_02495 [Firmicutes bacterium]|nr:hypothetical protein [Bacillota bacterium]
MTLEAVLASNASKLMQKANVEGVGIGFKVRRGRQLKQPCLTVLVKEKLPLAALAPQDIVPSTIAGYKTDVVASGTFYALQMATKQEPAAPGSSIGHYRVTAGTFGAVVADAHTGQALILSNNHVLANSSNGRDGRAFYGDPILHPAPVDGGKLPADLIAHLYRFVPLTFLPAGSSQQQAASLGRLSLVASQEATTPALTNVVDAAVALPVSNARIIPSILGIGPLAGTQEAALDMIVLKSGRTTGVTVGSVLLLNAVVRVDYGAAGTAIFTDQIISDLPSAPGDSGSLVVDERSQAVGLLFAGGNGLTVINRIAQVEQELGIRIMGSI